MEEVHIEPAAVLVEQEVINKYSLYISDEIVSSAQFLEHYHVMKTAQPPDVILLYINSPGGDVGVGQEYIRHMRECSCPIIGFIGMNYASQAAAIAVSCDDIVTDEMSTMLIHQFSYCVRNTAGAVYDYADFNKKLNKVWLDTYFDDILNEQEKVDVLKNNDILLNSEQIQERWEAKIQASIYEEDEVEVE